MALVVHSERAGYHPRAFDYFDFERLDAFHDPDVLSIVHGDEWRSILITDGTRAFLHAFAARPIGDTGRYDIDPLLGYGGPLVTEDDPRFVRLALAAHGEFCRGDGIVAEVVRFSPILGNHQPFEDAGVPVAVVKDIVAVACRLDEARQMAGYTKSCRSSVRRGARDLEFRQADMAGAWDDFRLFYHDSLTRAGAGRRWHFPPDFFARAEDSRRCALFQVRRGGDVVSAALLVHHASAAYYLIAANGASQEQGASELLVHGIAGEAARRGAGHLILGGGNSPSPDDPLFRFKRKFATDTLPFRIGKLVHDGAAFRALVAEAEKADPALVPSSYFLKYRLGLHV